MTTLVMNASPAEPFKTGMSIKVLVVDDSMMIRAAVERLLAKAGFTVAAATDGCDALAKLDKAPDTGLVVCDVNMPNMDGLELLEEVRVARKSKVPFVMLTTESVPEVVTRAKALGVNGWLVKPIKPELLLSTVRDLTAS